MGGQFAARGGDALNFGSHKAAATPLLPSNTMKKILRLLAVSATLSLSALLPDAALAQVAAAAPAEALPTKFEPARNAERDLATAVALAKAQGKRVMVDVGGQWCPWCHILDRFIAANADVKGLLDAHYVWLKINYSPDNKNEAFLSRWPKVKGYPHLFVLDADGKLLHSQDTGDLEAGKDYDKPKMLAFLKQHAGK
jgi:thiol:disulfide interchange protein